MVLSARLTHYFKFRVDPTNSTFLMKEALYTFKIDPVVKRIKESRLRMQFKSHGKSFGSDYGGLTRYLSLIDLFSVNISGCLLKH